jgi:hypothetical protein
VHMYAPGKDVLGPARSPATSELVRATSPVLAPALVAGAAAIYVDAFPAASASEVQSAQLPHPMLSTTVWRFSAQGRTQFAKCHEVLNICAGEMKLIGPCGTVESAVLLRMYRVCSNKHCFTRSERDRPDRRKERQSMQPLFGPTLQKLTCRWALH